MSDQLSTANFDHLIDDDGDLYSPPFVAEMLTPIHLDGRPVSDKNLISAQSIGALHY